jgi:hypothetical protein
MTSPIRLALIAFALVLLLGFCAWYYLYGPNKISAAELVPSDTVVFATIPNAAELTTDYQTSHLKELVDSPNAKPLVDAISQWLGQKNLDLLLAFAPNLSGQSFIAVTHIDPTDLSKIGLIAGLKPKPGIGDFDGFVDKLKAAYPDALAHATSGAGQVEGLDYQWLQGPQGSNKFCVARVRGWIVIGWGEDALRDWWERYQKKASTPNLVQNADYQKSLDRVGKNSEAVLYLDGHALVAALLQHRAAANPPPPADLVQKWQALGAIAVGSSFEQGDIADHFSFLMPHTDSGFAADPCTFDTLKFTGPDTRFYWGSSANWNQVWKNLQEQPDASPPGPPAGNLAAQVQAWAQSENLDIQHNIIDPLGNEASIQAEWGSDTSYPEIGFMVKLDKPDDFKPTVNAIIDTVRKRYETTAVVNEINSNGQNFATLKFVEALPFSPTITEDGPYFGVFLTENQAVRVFQRDATVGLLANDDFKRQIGDKRQGAGQIVFLDSPRLLDRTYQTSLPYLSVAAMFNRALGSMLQGRTLPTDLQWLAPMDTWSWVISPDADGFKGYSISGIGNQGIYFGGGAGGIFHAWMGMGHPLGPLAALVPPPPAPAPPPPPPPPPPAVAPATNAPDVTTPPAPTPEGATNAAPAASPPPDSSTNAPPSPPSAPGH